MADAGAKVLRGLLDVFVLESLERGPKHGYALLREMADAFGTEPNRNRLYPLLGRMVQDGLIAERSDGDHARTLYVLTDAGHAAIDGYRKLPPAFHERLRSIWSMAAPAEGRAPTPQAPGQGRSAPAPRMVSIPVASAPRADAGESLPYPCPDARVTLERDLREGGIRIALAGCPMGAYEYCQQCPVFAAVEGLRKLTLG